MHLILLQKFCITCVFISPGYYSTSQEKLITMLMQNFGGAKKGALWEMCKLRIWASNYRFPNSDSRQVPTSNFQLAWQYSLFSTPPAESGCIRRLTSNFHLQTPTSEWAWFSPLECQVILLEIVPNLRANFEEKTSRGGRPHNLYLCEILTLKSLYIFLSAN